MLDQTGIDWILYDVDEDCKLYYAKNSAAAEDLMRYTGYLYCKDGEIVNGDDRKLDGVEIDETYKQKLLDFLTEKAESFRFRYFSWNTYIEDFGTNGECETYLGTIIVDYDDFEKMQVRFREKYFGLIKPTLQRPLFIIKHRERDLFVKSFIDRKDNTIIFFSVVKNENGQFELSSNHEKSLNGLLNKIREGEITLDTQHFTTALNGSDKPLPNYLVLSVGFPYLIHKNNNFSDSNNFFEEKNDAHPKKLATNDQIREMLDSHRTSGQPYSEEEKDILRRYSGQGGNKATEERGMLDEFYTPDFVCENMYRLAVKHGYKSGKILEPSCATGNIIRPFYDRNDYTHIDAFEINGTSREICKILYPNVNIYDQYFETAFLEAPRFSTKAKKTWLSNAPYDLAAGNPPYGIATNRYSSYFTGKEHFKQLEMFFMYKSLQLLRSGGLLVFITSTNFMSTGNMYQNAKNMIGEIATLVDAYRLPKVFESTAICTDIIVLRKK